MSAPVPSRWRCGPEPSRWRCGPEPSRRRSDTGRGHAAPLLPPGRPTRPTGRFALGLSRSRVLARAPGRPATAGGTALPGVRARGWVKAAKMAQRRRLAEDAGGRRGPTPGSQRAALYVHVSGEVRRRLGRGGPEARRRLSRCEPTCRLSPLPDEVWGKCLGPET